MMLDLIHLPSLLCGLLIGGPLGMVIMAALAMAGRHDQAEEKRIRAGVHRDTEAKYPHPDSSKGITLPTVGSHQTNPFNDKHPDRRDRQRWEG